MPLYFSQTYYRHTWISQFTVINGLTLISTLHLCYKNQLIIVVLGNNHSCFIDPYKTQIYSAGRMKYSGVCYNERCYNERMLQRTVFINKIRMLQWTERNIISRQSTHVHETCQAFLLWLERQSSSLLSFVRFSYQFSSVICLFAPLVVKIFFVKLFLYTILAVSQQNSVRMLINLDIKKEIPSKWESGKSVGDLSAEYGMAKSMIRSI